jgi:ribosomal-protein-alanine N-acetyltransferase
MARLQRTHSESFFVAENNSSELVGYCVASEKERFAHLISIGVLREHRRKGVGAALLKTLLAWLNDRPVDELWLEVNTGNKAAITFYERFGFARVMTIENYYADGSPAARMMLSMREHAERLEASTRGRKKLI